ncbi:MAG: response regulator [Tepidisphaeraceae bacterium]
MLPVVLIIDDSEWVHVMIAKCFGDEWTIAHAYSGVEGIEAAKRCTPDLILLDIDLPDMNGFDICRHLRAELNDRYVAIMFLSSCCSVDEKVCGLEIGAVDFVPKPFEIDELGQRVRNSLRMREMLSRLPDALKWCPPERASRHPRSAGRAGHKSDDGTNLFAWSCRS